MKRLLITRTDRIGDLLLATPVVSALRERFPRAHIVLLVRSYTRELVENNPDVSEVWTVDGEGFWSLLQRTRKARFNAALILLPTWRVSLSLIHI